RLYLPGSTQFPMRSSLLRSSDLSICCGQFRSLFFYFQAEDGIRDRNVTGVQTCALPICYPRRKLNRLYLGFTEYSFVKLQVSPLLGENPPSSADLPRGCNDHGG